MKFSILLSLACMLVLHTECTHAQNATTVARVLDEDDSGSGSSGSGSSGSGSSGSGSEEPTKEPTDPPTSSPSGGGGGSYSWRLATSTTRTITGVQTDPGDKQCSMHGSGSISISTNGIMTMTDSPRYYINAPPNTFLNVEMIAYGRLRSKKDFSDTAGMTMVTRSDHGDYASQPCSARGYYSRIYFNTGEFAFQKEFYHGDDVVYSASRRKAVFSGGFPVNKWIGMKYVLQTNSDGKTVHLKGFVDTTESGDWKLVFETDDTGGWKATKDVPSECGYKQDQIFLTPGKNSYFRTDDVDSFEWKNLQVHTI